VTGDQPEIRLTRSWTVTWKRTRQLGWPNIKHPHSKASAMAPKLLRVKILQLHEHEPVVERIEVRGTWLRSGAETTWQSLSLGPVPTTYGWTVAPDWARELAEQSLQMIKDGEQS
jgi:hypothetical protein